MFDRVEVYAVGGDLIDIEDTRTLEVAQSNANDFVNNTRQSFLDSSQIWMIGHPWDASTIARSNINGAISLVLTGVPLPSGFVWRDNNNVNVPFTATMLVGLGASIVGYVNELYNYSWYLKTLIDACNAITDVDALDLSGEWPDGNMDGTMPIAIRGLVSDQLAVGNSYTVSLDIHGGIPPYTSNISAGALPDGLSLANNVISGTPSNASVYTFTVTATDSTANTALIGNATYTVTTS